MAYLILAPKKLDFLYAFPWSADPGVMRPYFALAQMCLARSGTFADLPADVSQTLQPFIRQVGGPTALAELKRVRRG